MQGILNSTDVRKDWSRFIDDIVRFNLPKVVQRNRDAFISVSVPQQKMILSAYQFQAEFFQENDGTFTATLEGFDLVANGETKDETIRSLAYDLIEYAEEYMEDMQLYFNSPNRKNHFPYILNVLLQDDIEGVISLIHA